jgi:hypothetical protein
VGGVSVSPTGKFYLTIDGEVFERVNAASVDEAISYATAQVDPEDYDTSEGTVWVQVGASETHREDGADDGEWVMVRVDPPEPPCVRDDDAWPEHDWRWQEQESVRPSLHEPEFEVCGNCGQRRGSFLDAELRECLLFLDADR